MASSSSSSSSSSAVGGTGSRFQEIFGKPLPANPTLMEALSTPWKPKKPTDHSSFTEIFGELHFREPTYYDSPSSSSLSPPPPTSKDVNLQPEIEKVEGDDDKNNESDMKASSDSLFGIQEDQYMKSSKSTATGFSLKKAESLQLCTEGLGFESSGDVENSKDETEDDLNIIRKGRMSITRNSSSSGNLYGSRRLKQIQGSYPPPITCLGKNGKPWFCLKSFKYNGRFVLKEIEIPTKEILHACREDGRLTLHLVQRDDESSEADEYDDAYEQEDEGAAYNDTYEQEDKGKGKKSEFGNVKVEGNQ